MIRPSVAVRMTGPHYPELQESSEGTRAVRRSRAGLRRCGRLFRFSSPRLPSRSTYRRSRFRSFLASGARTRLSCVSVSVPVFQGLPPGKVAERQNHPQNSTVQLRRPLRTMPRHCSSLFSARRRGTHCLPNETKWSIGRRENSQVVWNRRIHP